MFNKTLSFKNMENFNLVETIKNVKNYFRCLEKLYWEWNKLNAGKGLTANYDFAVEYKKQQYIPIGKDVFNLSAKEEKGEQLKKYIASYYWAKSILSDMEQLYINERFINGKQERELIDLFGFSSIDSSDYQNLKRSSIYKFADFFNLVVRKRGCKQ